MIRVLSIVFFLSFLGSLNAQVPNNSFENWTGTEPNGWQTANIPIMPQSILQDTDAYNGNYSVRGVVVSSNFGQPFAPYLGYSGPSAQGYNITVPFAHLEGYCKLDLLNGDKFIGIAHVYNSLEEPIGDGSLSLDSSTGQWYHFSLDITYSAFDIDMSCALYFTISDSSGVGSGHVGSTFLLDYLSMSGLATLDVNSPVQNSLRLFPNPSADFVHINLNDQDVKMCELIDMTGKVVRIFTMRDEALIDIRGLRSGLYYLNIHSDRRSFSEKLLIAEN